MGVLVGAFLFIPMFHDPSIRGDGDDFPLVRFKIMIEVYLIQRIDRRSSVAVLVAQTFIFEEDHKPLRRPKFSFDFLEKNRSVGFGYKGILDH